VLFLEDQARLLLVLHAVLGAATVAVSTHLFLWARRWARGEGRVKGVRWFAVVAPAVYVTQFVVGNLAYPVYKIRVRAEYLDMPSAVAADHDVKRRAAEEIAKRAGVAPPIPDDEPSMTRSAVARLFDVKEHWAAIGLPLILAAAWLVFRWDPRREPSLLARWTMLATTGGAAAVAWFAALVGLYVSAIRAI
jgi:hypothetical protein